MLAGADERQPLRVDGIHDELHAFVRRLDKVRAPQLFGQGNRFVQPCLVHRVLHHAPAFYACHQVIQYNSIGYVRGGVL